MQKETVILLSQFIFLLPLFSFLLLIFFGKKFLKRSDLISTGILFLCLIFSSLILYSKLSLYPNETIRWTFDWVNFGNVFGSGDLKIQIGIAIDNMTAIMLVVVTLVSSLVHLFSTEYMHDDIRYSRYFAYLGIFTFSMLMIVLTDNFFTIYVGWELVGLSSYLLIGHWYEKKSASDASKKAFVVNRIGDI